MDDEIFPNSEEKRIERQACDWVARRAKGFSATEQDEFFTWLATDPRHAEAYSQAQQLWKRMDRLAEWMPEHSEKPNRDLLRTRYFKASWRWWGGLAASVMLGAVLWMQFAVTDGYVHQQSLVADGYESHVLPDGSTVEMNKGAAMRVDFSTDNRRVELVSSEAMFSVNKDPDRPFVVVAKGVEVQAIGTVFHVRISDSEVEVLVTEGRVRLDAQRPGAAAPLDPEDDPLKPSPHDLIAGQISTVSLHDNAFQTVVEETNPARVDEVLAWRFNLDFDSTPLAHAIAEINRRNPVQFVLADPELGTLPVVASIRTDNVDHFVDLLSLSMDITVEREGPNRVILRKK